MHPKSKKFMQSPPDRLVTYTTHISSEKPKIKILYMIIDLCYF